jgi:hypothetical protein
MDLGAEFHSFENIQTLDRSVLAAQTSTTSKIPERRCGKGKPRMTIKLDLPRHTRHKAMSAAAQRPYQVQVFGKRISNRTKIEPSELTGYRLTRKSGACIPCHYAGTKVSPDYIFTLQLPWNPLTSIGIQAAFQRKLANLV